MLSAHHSLLDINNYVLYGSSKSPLVQHVPPGTSLNKCVIGNLHSINYTFVLTYSYSSEQEYTPCPI